jgi:hypothetical protein
MAAAHTGQKEAVCKLRKNRHLDSTVENGFRDWTVDTAN